MLTSTEHEIFSANKYKNANKACSYLLAEEFSCSAMFGRKDFAVFSNLRFVRTNFMLSCIEHEKVL